MLKRPIPNNDQAIVEPMEKARSFMERAFGFRQFRSGQEEVLESVLDASDTLVIMPTGGGEISLLSGSCLYQTRDYPGHFSTYCLDEGSGGRTSRSRPAGYRDP